MTMDLESTRPKHPNTGLPDPPTPPHGGNTKMTCPLCQEEVAEENIFFRISELERKVSVIDKFLLQQESAEADPWWWRLRRWWRKGE